LNFVTDISERKHLESKVQTMLEAQQKWNAELEDKVRAKTAELRQLSETRDQLLRQMITAQEEERRRVARELHDETSQALTALIANLAIVQTLPPTKAKAHLDEIKSSIVETLKGVNRIVLDLRPTLLDDYGLMPALSWYANKRVGSGTRVDATVPEPGG
jgi:signal transduction histidine kinase